MNTKDLIVKQPINETISVNILLNVNYSALLSKNFHCKGCKAENISKASNDDIPWNRIERPNDKLIKVRIGEDIDACPLTKNCSIICGWLMTKQDFLRKELLALHKYLRRVDNPLFNTNIELNIIYGDHNKLDGDMFDNVKKYLENLQ